MPRGDHVSVLAWRASCRLLVRVRRSGALSSLEGDHEQWASVLGRAFSARALSKHEQVFEDCSTRAFGQNITATRAIPRVDHE
jgi:hypothetical protein